MHRLSLLVLAAITCIGMTTQAAQSTEPLTISGSNGLKVVYDPQTETFQAWAGDQLAREFLQVRRQDFTSALADLVGGRLSVSAFSFAGIFRYAGIQIMQNNNGYAIFDFMSIDNRIPQDEINYIINNSELTFMDELNSFSKIWVYKF